MELSSKLRARSTLSLAPKFLRCFPCFRFYGIPYASISARFRHSIPLKSWEGNAWDATKLRCVLWLSAPLFTILLTPPTHLFSGCSAQPNRPFYPFPMPPRPELNESFVDELNCCNLHITLPAGCTPTSNLPVLVFIHGGGFVSVSFLTSLLEVNHLHMPVVLGFR